VILELFLRLEELLASGAHICSCGHTNHLGIICDCQYMSCRVLNHRERLPKESKAVFDGLDGKWRRRTSKKGEIVLFPLKSVFPSLRLEFV